MGRGIRCRLGDTVCDPLSLQTVFLAEEVTIAAVRLKRERWTTRFRQVFLSVNVQITTLYRPVGQTEMDLIRAGQFREFPPRLPEQPIFYPVLTEEYATQIARDWNTKDERSGFAGYVLRFHLRTEFLRKYDMHIVGSSKHHEYWIPAEDLAQLNENIEGEIEVVSEFHGKGELREGR